jgi:glycosyltransferase involved in cell wall biosynthesis
MPYKSSRVRIRTVSPSGGTRITHKLGILSKIPVYTRTILEELPKADVAHIRCPANISLVALMLLTLKFRPHIRWVKYAGNWGPSGKEPLSYTLQRWWLGHRLHRGLVTVNGRWRGQPAHVRSFYNPCLTEDELAEANKCATSKQLTPPFRLLYVGALGHHKGIERALGILAHLVKRGVNVRLDLVGDGPYRPEFERLSAELKVGAYVKLHGWLPRTSLGPFYSSAHILLFPSSSEGWPKVLSEGMAYGVVPVASNVSCIPQYLQKFQTGRALPPDDLQGFVDAIAHYASHPDAWRCESQNGVRSAPLFSYANYLRAVSELLGVGKPEKILQKQSTGSGKRIVPREARNI